MRLALFYRQSIAATSCKQSHRNRPSLIISLSTQLASSTFLVTFWKRISCLQRPFLLNLITLLCALSPFIIRQQHLLCYLVQQIFQTASNAHQWKLHNENCMCWLCAVLQGGRRPGFTITWYLRGGTRTSQRGQRNPVLTSITHNGTRFNVTVPSLHFQKHSDDIRNLEM